MVHFVVSLRKRVTAVNFLFRVNYTRGTLRAKLSNAVKFLFWNSELFSQSNEKMFEYRNTNISCILPVFYS